MGTAILFSCRSRVFPFYQIPQIAQQSSASVHKGRREMCYTDSRISSYERSFVSMSQAAAQTCRLHKNAKVFHHLVLAAKVFKT